MHPELCNEATVKSELVLGCCHKPSNITLLSAAQTSGSSTETAWQKLSAGVVTCWYESWKTWPLLTVTGSTFLPFLPTTARRSGPTSCLAARAAISLHNGKGLRPGREGGQNRAVEGDGMSRQRAQTVLAHRICRLEEARRRGNERGMCAGFGLKSRRIGRKATIAGFSNGWKG
jgi:hypothetical protein